MRSVGAGVVIIATGLYLIFLAIESPRAFFQVFLDSVIDGSVYGLVAIGFGLMYSTVRFFDISYAIMPAASAFAVFYFNQRASRFVSVFVVGGSVSAIVVGTGIGLIVALNLSICAYPALRSRLGSLPAQGIIAVTSLILGLYSGALFLYPDQLEKLVAPVAGLVIAASIVTLGSLAVRCVPASQNAARLLFSLLAIVGLGIGVWCGVLLYGAMGAKLYIGWVLGIALSGLLGMLFYGGLLRYLSREGRSLLVPMVGSLGIYMAMVALFSIIFTPNVKSLPVPFGSDSIAIAGAYIKPFSLFFIAVVIVFFAGFVLVLKKTTLGKEIRAIADDRELAMTVGINVSAVTMIVFAIGACCGAMAGIFVAQDTAFKPTTGLQLLFQGWVASVVGGLGNIYGALAGGLLLGLLENYAIWYVPSEWKNSIAFGMLIVFALLWPKGLLPRR